MVDISLGTFELLWSEVQRRSNGGSVGGIREVWEREQACQAEINNYWCSIKFNPDILGLEIPVDYSSLLKGRQTLSELRKSVTRFLKFPRFQRDY